MAKLTFRQGIVLDHQGGSSFLSTNGDYVQLNATTGEPVQITIADGSKDYLFTERTTVAQAWGPFTVSDDQWLYWDINRTTGVRTFGSTSLSPIISSSTPLSPSTGQMWFDTTENIWKEWTGASWKKVLRVFAAKFAQSSTFESVSINAGSGNFKGTQVGLTTTVRAGAIVFDANAKPILDAENRFFTTEDTFFTGLPSGARLRIGNFVKTAQATENIPAYSVVVLDGANSVRLATVSDQGRKVLGLVEHGVSTGDLISFTTEGVFFNQNWNWFGAGLSVNDPVYINNAGAITKQRQSTEQQPIGVVMDTQTIMFAPRLFPQLETEGDVPLENLTQSGATDAQVIAWNAANGQWEPADSGTSWGEISGTLSDQTDLQNALDSKVNLSGDETISGNKTFTDNMTIQGNLTVGGTTTTVNTEELVVSDNIIELNSDASSTPSENAGIRVNRGSSTDAIVLWDESTDSWKVGLSGSETEIALVGHTHDTNDIVSGTFADARIAQTNVTQHESALAISFGQMSDSINDAQVPSSAVTQHEGSLTIATTQLTQGTATSGNFLRWDGTAWTASQAAIDDLSDVDTSTSAPSTDDVLKWDGANWVPQPGAPVDVSNNGTTIVTDTDDINFGTRLDVTDDGDSTVTVDIPITGVDANVVTGTAGTSGNVVQWNVDGDAVDSGTAISNLVLTSSSIDALTDVDTTTTAPSGNDVLKWNGSNWVPAADTDTRADISDNGTLIEAEVLDINFSTRLNVSNDGDGTVTVDIPITGADANVVTGTAGTSGNLVEWNIDGDAVDSGTATANLVLTSSSIDALSDVDTTTSAPSTDDVLKWDGTNWVPQADTDTRTDVSDDGTLEVSGVSDINFSSYLAVTDDNDGTVTVNVESTGVDALVVSGTAGTGGNLVEWNADGDAVDSTVATSNLVLTSSSIDALSDVDTTTTAPSSGDVLQYDGTNWVPGTDTDTQTDVSDNGTTVVSSVTDINFSTNLNVTDDTDGTVTVDATDTNTQTDVSDNGTTVVSSVGDVNFSSYLSVTDDTDGTVTVNVPATGIDSNLVSGTAGTSGNLIEWNADGDAVDSGTATSNLVLTSSSIDALNDVDTTTTAPSSGDILQYDGTNWVPGTDTDTQTDVSDNGTTVVSSVTDINFNSYLNVTDDTDGTVTVDVPSTGIDSNVVTGTAGTGGNLVEWNADGDAVDSGTATSNVNTVTLVQYSVESISTSQTLPVNNGVVYLTTNAITVTLPDATTNTDRVFIVKNTDGSSVTIDTNGGNIDGSTSTTLSTQYASVTVVSNGTNWFTI